MGTVRTGRRAIGIGGGAALALTALGAVLPAPAPERAGDPSPIRPPEPAHAQAGTPCAGAPLPDPDRVIAGGFPRGLRGSYVMVPFDVPAGTDAVRVKYCHDQPLLASQGIPEADRLTSHTLDMGVYGPRPQAGDWGVEELRGWGGSSRRDVTISPEGSIDPDPAPVASEETTVGYLPGPIEPGEWAVELGVAAVGPELPLVEDGAVRWRVEIDLISDPAYADEPYEPVPYDDSPARGEPGWYAGDLHVHARHSNPGDATMRETFDHAFDPLADGGAGLDFITLSDYVGSRHWGEIGAFQGDYPGRLIIRSAEVITYRGHLLNHASAEPVDHRTGPVYERRGDGSLERLRGPTPPREALEAIQAAGGWTQIAHPTIFPSQVPTFSSFCRGCPWDYGSGETGYPLVDAIEVSTGPAGVELEGLHPGPNPFTPLALLFYDRAIDTPHRNANRIAAVGVSDSHNAGVPDDPILQAPIGRGTTVVRAAELSEQGIADGIRAGHTYVKLWGNDGPDLRFTARPAGSSEPRAIIGEEIAAPSVRFTARVTNLLRARAAYPGLWVLLVVRDGVPVMAAPILGDRDEFEFRFPSLGPDSRYRLQLHRLVQGALSVDAVSSPIYHRPPGGGG